MIKNLAASAGGVRDAGLILGWEDPLEEEMANPLHYSCLEKSVMQNAQVRVSIALDQHGLGDET